MDLSKTESHVRMTFSQISQYQKNIYDIGLYMKQLVVYYNIYDIYIYILGYQLTDFYILEENCQSMFFDAGSTLNRWNMTSGIISSTCFWQKRTFPGLSLKIYLINDFSGT